MHSQLLPTNDISLQPASIYFGNRWRDKSHDQDSTVPPQAYIPSMHACLSSLKGISSTHNWWNLNWCRSVTLACSPSERASSEVIFWRPFECLCYSIVFMLILCRQRLVPFGWLVVYVHLISHFRWLSSSGRA